MSRRFDAGAVMRGLRPFQRSTVDHVMERLYGDDGGRRFLVADETGLGKSMVARGVIARAIEHLQDDDTVPRIDVVYVCSNADIAAQNISRLNVTGEESLGMASRLTLLASRDLQAAGGGGGRAKGINLISFTPGTSFDMGWQTGQAEERALLFLLLRERYDLRGARASAAMAILQGAVTKLSRFRARVAALEEKLDDGGPVETVTETFRRLIAPSIGPAFEEFVDGMGRRRSLRTREERQRATRLIAALRGQLAQASVATLEPDLVILDEFQRFRHLLDKERGGEAAELAHHLFEFPNARVLLLSATPYKPFTYAEEAALGDDHYEDFVQVLRFLGEGDGAGPAEVMDALAEYRRRVVAGLPSTEVRDRVRTGLIRYLSRVERPQLGEERMLEERSDGASPPSANDLLSYVGLHQLAAGVDGHLPVEYWKSAPYFVNFLDGYQIGERLRAELRESPRSSLQAAIRATQHLDRSAIERFEPIDLGNPRLRRLAADTVESGWWKLLWVPPSLPYHEPGGPFPGADGPPVTKRLVFSSWRATPTAIASLLSYEADRRIVERTRVVANTPEGRRLARRLDYRLEGQRPGGMTTLMLFWPNPGLAGACDPLAVAREAPRDLRSADDVQTLVAGVVARTSRPTSTGSREPTEAWYWSEALRWGGGPPLPIASAAPGELAASLEGIIAAADEDGEAEEPGSRLDLHVEAALAALRRAPSLPDPPGDLDATVALIGLHAPGNVAWRALARILPADHGVSAAGHWRAAAVLASGFRTLFNRFDAILLLDRLLGQEEAYWRRVLAYCAWGNLQAVMDEYVHHLAESGGSVIRTDQDVLSLAGRARGAIAIHTPTYRAFDPTHPRSPIAFPSRFALRYGSSRSADDDARSPEVREAFNSPFWPFVLATTSVGQEGIDFHWWCHAVQHWNAPPNPVDFEQREGRVHRYGGLAIRRNIAAKHRGEILARDHGDPWKAAFDVAAEHSTELGELAPHWIYPGPAKVQRITCCLPLSIDVERLARLKGSLALYRLCLGQPRQEDLLELLKRRGVEAASLVSELRIDLRPPRGTWK